jgi:hypothetical protein
VQVSRVEEKTHNKKGETKKSRWLFKNTSEYIYTFSRTCTAEGRTYSPQSGSIPVCYTSARWAISVNT